MKRESRFFKPINQTAMKKKELVAELLIDVFDRINIQTPSNFDAINDFVCKNTNKNCNEEDVALGFKKWIESK